MIRTPAQVIETWYDSTEMRLLPGTSEAQSSAVALESKERGYQLLTVQQQADRVFWDAEEKRAGIRAALRREMVASGNWEYFWCSSEREEFLRWIGSHEGYTAWHLETFGETP